MKKNEITKIGIVGCGVISKYHAEALSEIKKCRIVSACDIDKRKAQSLASKYSIPKVYDDFSCMLEKEDLHIVNVLTPPQAHASLSIQAMKSGRHVLVEKPMCINTKEADLMIETAKRNRVKLGVVHSFLFHPAVRQAIDAVKRNEIGELVWVDTLVSVKALLRDDRLPSWLYSLPGGLYGEIIPHGLYLQLAFLKNVRKILSITRKNGETSELLPFSELGILMDSETGIGSLCLSSRTKSPYTVMMMRIIGDRKALFVILPTATVIKTEFSMSTSSFARSMINLKPVFQLLSKTTSLGINTLLGLIEPHMTTKIVNREFIESVQNDSEPPVSAQDGRKVVQVTEMIWEKVL